MSNYGADSTPDMDKARTLAYDMNFLPRVKVQNDQFTIDETTVVYKYNDGSGKIRLKIKANPNQIPS